MLNLKEKIFGDMGFSSDLRLSSKELTLFRQLINDHWFSVINTTHPDLGDEARKVGIENYHEIADRVNHAKLWNKWNRMLPRESVNRIKKMPFFSVLKAEFGDFSISDAVYDEQDKGREEIYWRLVRPSVQTDINPLHKDKWYHDAFNQGDGMFPEGTVTVKIWIPIYCEPGKNGLALLPGSQNKNWKYHIEVIDGVPKPIPDEDLTKAGAELVLTDPGNMLIFNENLLHGGVFNSGNQTRVSVEITILINKQDGSSIN